MKKSIWHACSLTRDTNRAASVTDHYLWINLERFIVKIWIVWPLDLFKDVLQTLANSQQKEIQSSFTLYTGQIDPQTWRVHVNQCGSFRCMRESTRGSYEAPESCRTRSDAQPLIRSTLNIPSPLIWKRKTEMRRAANTATRLQWEQDRQTTRFSERHTLLTVSTAMKVKTSKTPWFWHLIPTPANGFLWLLYDEPTLMQGEVFISWLQKDTGLSGKRPFSQWGDQRETQMRNGGEKLQHLSSVSLELQCVYSRLSVC